MTPTIKKTLQDEIYVSTRALAMMGDYIVTSDNYMDLYYACYYVIACKHFFGESKELPPDRYEKRVTV